MQPEFLRLVKRGKPTNATNTDGIAAEMVNIDAEYEALCAEELATV